MAEKHSTVFLSVSTRRENFVQYRYGLAVSYCRGDYELIDRLSEWDIDVLSIQSDISQLEELNVLLDRAGMIDAIMFDYVPKEYHHKCMIEVTNFRGTAEPDWQYDYVENLDLTRVKHIIFHTTFPEDIENYIFDSVRITSIHLDVDALLKIRTNKLKSSCFPSHVPANWYLLLNTVKYLWFFGCDGYEFPPIPDDFVIGNDLLFCNIKNDRIQEAVNHNRFREIKTTDC